MHIFFGCFIFIQSHMQLYNKNATLNGIFSRITTLDADLKRMAGDNKDQKAINRQILIFETIAVAVSSICFLLISIYDLVVFQP